MPSDVISPNLAIISFMIATDPNYVPQLKKQIEARRLDSGQIISEEEAVLLTKVLEQGTSLSYTISDWISDPSGSDTWIG